MKENEITVRVMTLDDVPAVHEIEEQSFSIPWSKKAFQESLGYSHAVFLVAETGDSIAGYCGMYQVFQEGDIINVAVAPGFRGKGIGGKLMEGIICAAIERDILDLTLEVRESNETAIHLYTKYGFENVGIRKNFYEQPRENAIIMWKRGIK